MILATLGASLPRVAALARARRRLGPSHRRWTYPAAGALLALVLAVGYLALRLVASGQPPDGGSVLSELRDQRLAYAYIAVVGGLAFLVLGRILGRKEDQLEARSATDPLTGLANRRSLDERLAYDLARAGREGSPLAFLLVDVDGLKAVNDLGGHEAGDAALRAVAESLRRSCRATDFAARLGGDEFAVVAPATTAREAVELARRIQAALRSVAALSVSIGVTDDARAGGLAAEGLYRSADRAMYGAKAAGRDRIEVAAAAGPSRVASR